MSSEGLALATPLIALAPSLILLHVIRCLDPIEKEPAKYTYLGIIAGCFSVIPVFIFHEPASILFNSITQDPGTVDLLDSSVYAPFAEEISKLLLLIGLLLIVRRETDSLVDYIIYSASIAIGFEFIENILYQWSSLQESSAIDSWLFEFDGRTIGKMGGHLLYSIWNGVAIWIFKSFQGLKSKLLFILAIAFGILLHSINNLSATMSTYGAPSEILPINHFGNILYSVNEHISLACFMGAIGAAVLFDAATLHMLHIEIITKYKSRISQQEEETLHNLSNPFLQCLSSSSLIWLLTKKGRDAKAKQATFKRFAKYALAFGRESQHSKKQKTSPISQANEIVLNAINLIKE